MLAVPTAPESVHTPDGVAEESPEGHRAPERLTDAGRVQCQLCADWERETQARDR